MTLRRSLRPASGGALEAESVLFGTPTQERLMLLELAAALQSWPARNVVFRNALDRAAQDLVRLASDAPVS